MRELMAIREIAHAFHTAKRPEEVYQFALDRVSPLVGAAFACVFVVDPGTDQMRLVAVHNWPQRYARFLSRMRVRVGHGPSGAAVSERRPIEVPDVLADPTLGDWHEIATELGFRSFVAVPLEVGHSVLGTVTFYFSPATTVGPEMRHLIRLVADQMAASAEKARLIASLDQVNQELAESRRLLEQRTVDLLALRAPLTAVIGYISILEEGLAGPLTVEQRSTLEAVQGASDELLTLIGNLIERPPHHEILTRQTAE
jgi:GAF domain-containing protein